jgi:hypothetical protein
VHRLAVQAAGRGGRRPGQGQGQGQGRWLGPGGSRGA